MTKFTLEIECDNAAFDDDQSGEIARMLEQAAKNVRDGYVSYSLSDANGNRVGGHLLADYKAT